MARAWDGRWSVRFLCFSLAALSSAGCDTGLSPSPAANTWGAPQRLWIGSHGEICGQNKSPAIAFDRTGAAFALWLGSDGVGCRVWVSRLDPSDGWAQPQPIDEPRPGKWIIFQSLGVAANGTAVAIWQERSWQEGYEQLCASRHAPGRTWSRPESIGLAGGGALGPVLSVDASGRAVVVWSQERSPSSPWGEPWANRLSSEGRWSGPERLGTSSEDCVGGYPRVTLTDRGEAFASWTEACGRRYSGAGAVRLDPVRGWGRPTKIDAAAEFSWEHSLVAESDGSAVLAMLRRPAPGSMQIEVWVFHPQRGWEPVGALDEGYRLPLLRAVRGRLVTAFWSYRPQRQATNELRFARLGAGPAWEALGAIQFDAQAPYIRTFDLAVSAAGSAFAAWTLESWPTNSVWVSRFTNRWEPPQRLLSAGQPSRLEAEVSIAADERGNAAAVWLETRWGNWVDDRWQASPLGPANIWASRYVTR